jgi:hypothetical protein
MKKIVKVGIAAKKRKSRKKPDVPGSCAPVEAECATGDAESFVTPCLAVPYLSARIDPLKHEFKDYSSGPTFLEHASEEDDEDSGMWGWWVFGVAVIGLLVWWALS